MAPPDFAKIFAKIPTSRSAEDVAKRGEMFKSFDMTGNGLLSLADIDKGLRDVLQVDEIFDVKPVIMRAFTATKEVGVKHGVSKHPDYVHKVEFRVLLVYLEEYFKVWQVFAGLAADVDHRLTKEEFTNGFDQLKPWTSGKSSEEVWQSVDQSGGKHVLFTDFAHWAIPQILTADHIEIS